MYLVSDMLFYSISTGSGKVPYTDMGVCAGFPSPAMDYTTESINLNDILVRDKDTTRIAFASGDLTFGSQVRENDILIIDIAQAPRNHDLVVYLQDGEYCLKRIKLEKKQLILLSANNEQSIADLETDESHTIYGVVTYSIRPHRKDIHKYPGEETEINGEETTINLHKLLTKESPTVFLTHVKGHSMYRANVHDKDLLVVERLLEPRNNDLVIAYVDREFTLKRIQIEKNSIWLVPANENFQPIQVTENNEFDIWGVVTYSIRNQRHYEQQRPK